jgi:hypothetical protein
MASDDDWTTRGVLYVSPECRELFTRIYDKHGPPFREWVTAVREGHAPGNSGAGGPPPGWTPFGLHTNVKGDPGLWIAEGSSYIFVPARFLVGVELKGRIY